MKINLSCEYSAYKELLFRRIAERGIYHCVDHDNGSNRWTLPVVQGAM